MHNMPSLIEMLEAGVHFGHQTSRWHPKMEPYIFTQRGGVHIINLEETQRCLKSALEYVRSQTAQGKVVLFLGTKNHLKAIIKEAAQQAQVPYITERWIGGLLTNYSELKKLIQKFNKLKKEQQEGAWEKYTKREQSKLGKEVEKMSVTLEGLMTLDRLPDIVFVADMRTEKTAIKEANQTGVPLVAICDTNVNPAKATYAIPANDDAVRSVALIANLVAQAVQEGRKEYEQHKKAQGVVNEKKETKPKKAAVIASE